MLKTAMLFQDHMVLQKDKEIAVWGTSDPHAEVTVTIQGKTARTRTEEDGSWKVLLPPLEVSFEETMTICTDREELVLQDVQVGEVWLAGGQSNMEFHMRYDADMESETKVCTNDAIRFFDYPEVSYVGQLDEADYSKNYGFWRKAAPEQLERFSAVGYYFAKDLQAKYKVPVGIVGCNWGGTPACAWMSEEWIRKGGGQVLLDEYAAAISDLDLEAYDRDFKANPMSYRTDQLADMFSDLMMRGCTIEELMQKLAAMGVDLSTLSPDAMAPVTGPKYERRPSGLYESMLLPVAPYGVRGVIWYQGETDGDTHPELYAKIFEAMIRNWRELWQEELPFLFVQIAPLDHWMMCNGTPYAQIREAQQQVADTAANTGMAVITDVGMQFDIHPKKKQPVGHRLALLAENKVYGENVLCEAPSLKSVHVEDGQLILSFDHAGDGLYLTDSLPDGSKVDKSHLGGLQVFQDGEELPADQLSAKADGNTVIISGQEIRKEASYTVKLARTGWYQVNLYNSADLPARPAEI